MRTVIVSSLILLMCSIAAGQNVAPDELLQRGKDNFRSGHFDEAVNDLKTAADLYLSPEQKASYISTGHLASLPKLEEAFVYLAISYARLGKEEEVRDTVARLLTAERIEPTYAKLTLDPDAAEFEQVAAKLAPRMPLPANEQLASGTQPPTPLPAVVPATAAPTVVAAAPETITPTPVAEMPAPPAPAVPAPAPAPTAVAQGTVPVQPTMAQERAEILRLIDERVAEARAQIEKDAEARIAQERAAAQKAADERIAQERAAAQSAAEQRVAQEREAAQKSAEQRVAEERAAAQKAADERIAQERAAAQKAADERVLAERAAIQRAADQRVAEERAAAEKAAQERIAAAEAEQRRAVLVGLRQAETFASSNDLTRANAIYNGIVNSPNSSREAIAAAATGLYRTGDFAGAVRAFNRLGTFAKGEEDLRYYNAVSLYETGNYDQAKKELSCALPFIQQTSDVTRYRAKIENTPSQQAMK